MMFRLLNLILAAGAAYFVFVNSYAEFYEYLPAYSRLKEVNTAPSVLRENTMGLRELYINAFEQSALYAFLTFVTSFIVLEYVRVGNLFGSVFKGMKSDYQVITNKSGGRTEGDQA
jgi:hypothetical protein